MNLVKKVIEIDERYSMYFDMESVLMYKEAKDNFTEGYNKILKSDIEATLDFIACTLRDKENGNHPVGFDFIALNPLFFFCNFQDKVFDIIASSFENDEENNIKKK